MPVISVNGADIHYRQGAENADKNLVLIHGSGGTGDQWPEEVFCIKGLRTIAPDLPGHGLSGGEPSSDVAEYAAFISDFVKALGLDRAALGGHSLGGAVSLACALEARPWLTHLVLVGTGARLRVNPMILEGLERDFEGALALMDQVLFGPDADEELRKTVQEKTAGTDAKVLLGDFTACDRFDVMDRLAEIQVPALVISASHDQLTPLKYGQFLADHLPDARMEVLEGAGHLLALEKAKTFARAVEDFLVS